MYPYIQIILPSYAVLAFMGFFLVVIFLYLRLEKFKVDFGDCTKPLTRRQVLKIVSPKF